MNQDSDYAPLFPGNGLLSEFFSSVSSSSIFASNQLARRSASFLTTPKPIVNADSTDGHANANGEPGSHVTTYCLTGLLEDVVKLACNKHSPFNNIHPFDLNHRQGTEFARANGGTADDLLNPDYGHVFKSHYPADNVCVGALCDRKSIKSGDCIHEEPASSCLKPLKHAFLQLPPLISVDTIADEGGIWPSTHTHAGGAANAFGGSAVKARHDIDCSRPPDSECKDIYGALRHASPLYLPTNLADVCVAHATDVADIYMVGAHDNNAQATHILHAGVTHESKEPSDDYGKKGVFLHVPHDASHLYAAANDVADMYILDKSVASMSSASRDIAGQPSQASSGFKIADQAEQVPESLSFPLNWLVYRRLAAWSDLPVAPHSLGDSSQGHYARCSSCARGGSNELCRETPFSHERHQGIDDYCIDLNSLPVDPQHVSTCRASAEQLQLLLDHKKLPHALDEMASVSPATCKLFRSSCAERCMPQQAPRRLSEEPLRVSRSNDNLCAQYSLLRDQTATAETPSSEDKSPRRMTTSSLIISNVPSVHSTRAHIGSNHRKRPAMAILNDADNELTNWSRPSSSPPTKKQCISSYFSSPTGGRSINHLRSDGQLPGDTLAGMQATLSSLSKLQPAATCMDTPSFDESKIEVYKQKLTDRPLKATHIDRGTTSMPEKLATSEGNVSQVFLKKTRTATGDHESGEQSFVLGWCHSGSESVQPDAPAGRAAKARSAKLHRMRKFTLESI